MKPQVIVLAGGEGNRLKSVVDNVPKPMAPMAGRPFLRQILDRVKVSGFDKAILSVGHKYEVIQQYFGHQFKGLKLEYAIEEKALGTGGGIRLAMERIETETVLVINGDTYFNVDLNKLLAFHSSGGYDLSIAVKYLKSTSRYGQIILEKDRITGFIEKDKSSGEGLINGGIYALNVKDFLAVTKPVPFSFETDFVQTFYQTMMFGGYQEDGYFIDIGIPEDYEKANAYFRKLQA